MNARKAWIRTCLIMALAGVLSSLPGGLIDVSLAGMVRLKNGDVITGKILKVSGGEILVDTAHCGKVTVDAEHVVDLQSDRVLTVEYEDGRKVDGYIAIGPDGELVVRDSTLPTAGVAPAEPQPAEAKETQSIDLTEIDEIHEVTPYYRYVGNLDFGLNVASGNSDSENANLAALIAPSFGKNTIQLDGQWNRGKADGKLAASNWRINSQYERAFWDRWFWLVFNSYEQDRLQDLDLRITAGTGFGYTFFEPDPTLLKVSLGPAFVDENFEDSDDDRQFAALRWTLDFDHDLFSPDVSVYHNHKLTAGLTEDQLVALTAQGLKFGLIADFALKLEFQFDHNNKPAGGAKKDDYRYLVKLAYDFKGDKDDWWQ